MKIVIDANVYASALMKPNGTAGEVLYKIISNQELYTIVSSIEIIAEVEKVIQYPKVRKRVKMSDHNMKLWMFSIESLSEIVKIDNYQIPVIIEDDPDDDKYILASIASKAKYLISGDQHLLKLKNYQSTKIITPRNFLDIIC